MKKFVYKPGIYPLPMIMIYSEENKEVFFNDYKKCFGQWTNNKKNLWTINSYIIFDQNEVIAYRYNDISNLIWLLRFNNKPITICFDLEDSKIIEKEFTKEFDFVESVEDIEN